MVKSIPQLPSLCFASCSFLDEHEGEADNEDVKSFGI